MRDHQSSYRKPRNDVGPERPRSDVLCLMRVVHPRKSAPDAPVSRGTSVPIVGPDPAGFGSGDIFTVVNTQEQGRTFAMPCYCGRVQSYPLCCQPIINRQTDPATAEDLMRSRYTAFCVGADTYLLHSWDPETRPQVLRSTAGQNWTGLEVLATESGEAADSSGTVEFVARFTSGLEAHELHEISNFRRFEGRWVYVNGVHSGGR